MTNNSLPRRFSCVLETVVIVETLNLRLNVSFVRRLLIIVPTTVLMLFITFVVITNNYNLVFNAIISLEYVGQ